jgi:hypothetical protein
VSDSGIRLLGLDIRALHGREGFRLRSVDYRAIYEVEGKQVAVIPADDYRVLLDKAEMLDDVAAHERAKAALASASRDASIAAGRGGRDLSSVLSADRDREAGGNRQLLSVVS